MAKKLLIEVIYKADYCLPCVYMDKAVVEVLPQYDGLVDYQRVCFMESDEAQERFLDLSKKLYGIEKVESLEQVAPVPSLFIEGELIFDMIPPRFELEEAIDKSLVKYSIMRASH
ncbi:MAG: hypothetical protein C0407_01835 [Desulfobacca sp.]|nr:hypothetical protein [Desulfobacca sp.]